MLRKAKKALVGYLSSNDEQAPTNAYEYSVSGNDPKALALASAVICADSKDVHRAKDRIVGSEGEIRALDAQSIILDFFWLCAENARVRGVDAAILDFFTRCAKRSVSMTT